MADLTRISRCLFFHGKERICFSSRLKPSHFDGLRAMIISSHNCKEIGHSATQAQVPYDNEIQNMSWHNHSPPTASSPPPAPLKRLNGATFQSEAIPLHRPMPCMPAERRTGSNSSCMLRTPLGPGTQTHSILNFLVRSRIVVTLVVLSVTKFKMQFRVGFGRNHPVRERFGLCRRSEKPYEK